MSEYYSHSGRSTFHAIALTLFGGLILSMLLGALYSIAYIYIPFIKIRFFITIGFGAAIGGVINYLAYVGKLRNNVVLAFITFLCGCAVYYSAWGMDYHPRSGFAVIPITDFYITYQPEPLLEYIKDFYDQGFWTMGSEKKCPASERNFSRSNLDLRSSHPNRTRTDNMRSI